jgi:hypothetical protein
LMTAVVPAHRCGAVPDFHRVPSYDTRAEARVNRPQRQYMHPSVTALGRLRYIHRRNTPTRHVVLGFG